MNLDLSGLHVLVTRPKPQGDELCRHIENFGGKALHVPTLAFVPLAETLISVLEKFDQYEWLIFNSPQAVFATKEAMLKRWPELPAKMKLATVGQGTANALKQVGYKKNILYPQVYSSEELLKLPELQAISGISMAVIRGKGGRCELYNVLAQRGAMVSSVMVYERVCPEINSDHYLPYFQENRINRIIGTSFEALKNLKTLFTPIWPQLRLIPLIVVSERIKILAQHLGFQTIWVAQQASDEAILVSLNREGKNHVGAKL